MFKPENALRSAKGNMLLVMVFTLVNLVMFFLNVNASFPFSLFSPFVMGIWAYVAFAQNFISDMILYLSIFVLVFGAFLASYLLALSKPKILILGLVVYLLDTAYLFYFYLGIGDNSWILDAVFHLWVILSLANAIYVSFKTKPQETQQL